MNWSTSAPTNLVRSSELLSIALLNAAGDPVVSAGSPVDLQQKDLLQEGEHWGADSVTFVTAIAGVNVSPEGETNATVVLPSFTQPDQCFTNAPRGDWRQFPRRDRAAGRVPRFQCPRRHHQQRRTTHHQRMPRGDRSNDFLFAERGPGSPGPPRRRRTDLAAAARSGCAG